MHSTLGACRSSGQHILEGCRAPLSFPEMHRVAREGQLERQETRSLDRRQSWGSHRKPAFKYVTDSEWKTGAIWTGLERGCPPCDTSTSLLLQPPWAMPHCQPPTHLPPLRKSFPVPSSPCLHSSCESKSVGVASGSPKLQPCPCPRSLSPCVTLSQITTSLGLGFPCQEARGVHLPPGSGSGPQPTPCRAAGSFSVP